VSQRLSNLNLPLQDTDTLYMPLRYPVVTEALIFARQTKLESLCNYQNTCPWPQGGHSVPWCLCPDVLPCPDSVPGFRAEFYFLKKSWITCVRLEDLIACMALPVPIPLADLEVPTPATASCGPIGIFEGVSFIWRTPFVPQPVWVALIAFEHIELPTKLGEVWPSTSLQGTRLRRQSAMKTGPWTWIGNSLRWRDDSSRRVLLKMELELKHLKLNPVTVTVTPVFPLNMGCKPLSGELGWK